MGTLYLSGTFLVKNATLCAVAGDVNLQLRERRVEPDAGRLNDVDARYGQGTGYIGRRIRKLTS